jgi:sugar lactone lactonase YvrE
MSEIRRIGETSDILGEGPVWDVQEQALYWADIRGRAVRRYDWRAGSVKSWTLPEMVGSLAVRRGGGLLLAMQRSISFFEPASGKLEQVDAPEAGREGMRFNDGKCDRQGRFWVGSMNDSVREPIGTLYRLDARRGCVPQVSGIITPNSLAWSPDGRTMYFSDSRSHVIAAYPFDPATGEIGVPRAFYRVEPPAIPDGATVDAEGYLWCALYGGWRIARIAPDGRLDRTIELPVQQPTSCQLAGPDLDVLLVTTAKQRLASGELAKQPLAGALLAIEVGVKGLAETRYRDDA